MEELGLGALGKAVRVGRGARLGEAVRVGRGARLGEAVAVRRALSLACIRRLRVEVLAVIRSFDFD